MADVKNSILHIKDTGMLDVQDACIVLVKTEWNAAVVDALEKGCRTILEQYPLKKIKTIIVPGAVEIPFAIRQYWLSRPAKKRPDAFIALGCVVRGDTPHFDYVCSSVTDGILQLNLELDAPTIFGVLTVNNDQQAKERIGGLHGHKGEESALTALKMVSLKRSFQQ